MIVITNSGLHNCLLYTYKYNCTSFKCSPNQFGFVVKNCSDLAISFLTIYHIKIVSN